MTFWIILGAGVVSLALIGVYLKLGDVQKPEGDDDDSQEWDTIDFPERES